MSERLLRLCYQNAAWRPQTVVTASSRDPMRGPNLLQNPARGARWRSALGWTVVAGFNDRFPFYEDGYARDARITAGQYATGDDYAAALEAALAAAPLYGNSKMPTSNVWGTVWLRADRPRRDYDALADGTALTAWQSWAGGSAGTVQNDLSEATNPPTWNTAQLNGRPVATFDGSNDVLTSAANLSALLGANGVCTGFAVVRSNAAGDGTQTVLSNATANWQLYYREASGAFRYGVSDGTLRTVVGPAATQDAYHIVTFMHDGANIYIGTDDTRTASLVSTACGTAVNLDEVLSMGVSAAANRLTGGIAELLIYPAALTEAERVRAEGYLASKWGITVASTVTWTNAYTAAYEAATHKLALTRATGAATWYPYGSDSWAIAPFKPERAGDEAAFRDAGFMATSYAPAASYTGSRAVHHGQEFVDFDLDAASCRVPVTAGVADVLDFMEDVGASNNVFAVTLDAGVSESPAALVASVQATLDAALGAYCVFAWDADTNKLSFKNVNYPLSPIRLLFASGPNAGIEGASAHRLLGWASVDVELNTGQTSVATRQLWGWVPVSTGIVLDHNSGAGGTYTLIADDQPIEGRAARAPLAHEWMLRGDERLRIGQRGLYSESPVNLGRRYLRLVIDDCGNEDGFSEIGVIYIGPYAQLSAGAAQPVLSTDPLSSVGRSRGGAHTMERRDNAVTYACSFNALTEQDRVVLEHAFGLCGLGVPLFVLEDAQSRTRILDWTYYVVFHEQPRFERFISDGDPPDRYRSSLAFVEDLP